MFTIKTAQYTQEEKKLLGILFGEMEKTLLTEHCSEKRCMVCIHRHICEDIHSANWYINNRLNK